MHSPSGIEQHPELRLIGGVFALIAATSIFGWGLLTGSERTSSWTERLERPLIVLPAERSRTKRLPDQELIRDPAWRHFGQAVVLSGSLATGESDDLYLSMAETLKGRIERPSGTPGDEALVIVASERRPTGNDTVGARRIAVRPDGTFEFPTRPDEDRVWLSLEGHYLRLDGGRRVRLAGLGEDEEVVLAPRLGARLSGEVTGLDESLGDVFVELSPSATGPAFARTLVVDGRFEFGGLGVDAPVWVRTSSELGWHQPPEGLELQPGEHQFLSFEVAAPAGAEGLAVDGQGDPLADVEVRARPLGQHSGRGDCTVRTDESGRFSFDGLRAGEWILFFEHEPTAERTRLTLESGQRASGLRLHAKKLVGHVFEVRFEEEVTAPDAHVRLVSQSTGDELTGTTDEAGALALERLAPGNWQVYATAVRGLEVDEGLTARWNVGSFVGSLSLPQDELQPVLLGGDGELVIQLGGENAGVRRVQLEQENGLRFEAEVDVQTLHVTGLDAGSWHVIASDEHGRERRARTPLEAGQRRELNLRTVVAAKAQLDLATGALAGRLRLGTEPHPGEVLIQPSTGRVRRLPTDPFGRFQAANIPIGPATVRVLLDGFDEWIERGVLVANDEEVAIEIALPTGALEGRVTDEAGRPLADLQVTGVAVGARSNVQPGVPRATKTDSSGRFFLPFLETGHWRLEIDGSSASLSRSSFGPIELAGGSTDDVYVLSNPTTLLGRVLDEEQEPVAGARLFGAYDSGERFELNVTTDDEGRWSLDNVAPGTWTILAVTDDGRRTTETTVEATAGERHALGKLVLARGAWIRVLPADESGVPIEAWIELFRQDGTRQDDLVTRGGDGTLRFGPLTDGTYWVRGVDAAGKTVSETIDLAGHDREVNLTF